MQYLIVIILWVLSLGCEESRRLNEDLDPFQMSDKISVMDERLSDQEIEHTDSVIVDTSITNDMSITNDLLISDQNMIFDQSLDLDQNFDTDQEIDQMILCSPCPEGYERGEECRCIDIDECNNQDNTLCEDSTCINHPGGYHCFSDQDQDHIDDWVDNCLGIPNPDQRDLDEDGLGNECDEDQDGDLVLRQLDCDDLDPFLGPQLQDSECDGAPDHLNGQSNLSVGWRHTCAISDDGSLNCWGGSPRIEEQTIQRFGALEVPTDRQDQVIFDWIKVSAGYAHTCGVRLGGILHCWGDDRQGQSSPPFNQAGETYRDWINVSTGGASNSFTCGLHAHGAIECWGVNDYGQITPPTEDEQGNALGPYVNLHAGYRHTCGLLADGRIRCWGSDQFGQVTVPSESELSTLISEGFEGLEGPWVAVGAGYAHSCGLRAGGGMYCWGLNTENQGSPINWDRFGRARQWNVMSVGGFHGCGVDDLNQLVCWGSNYTGQSTVPIELFGDPYQDWIEVIAGRHHSCGLRDQGQLLCWGWNDFGQATAPLGYRVRKPRNRDNCRDLYNPGQADLDGDGLGDLCDSDPDGDGLNTEIEEQWDLNPMHNDSDADGLSDSEEFGCELDQNDMWVCPELPRQTTTSQEIDALAADSDQDFIDDETDNCPIIINPNQEDLDEDGVGDLCDQDQDGDGALDSEDCAPRDPSYSWQSLDADCDGWLNQGIIMEGIRALGDRYSCALLSDGRLRCAGFDMHGQVRNIPTFESGVSRRDWTWVSAGMSHSCGIAGGELHCWGLNYDGRGTSPQLPLPEDLDDSNQSLHWHKVGLGVAHTCGETSSGVIRCWGNQLNGQHEVPTQANGIVIDDWDHWDAGGFHTCGIRSQGDLLCWGGNDYRQSEVPVLALDESWSIVNAGRENTCAILSSGKLQCWGSVASGILNIPILESPDTWWSVDVGRYHSCGLHGAGHLACWGGNEYGQVTIPEEAPIEGWLWVSAGGHHTCAFHDSNHMWCWGRDDHGEGSILPQWTLRSTVLQDNCPFTYNPDQEDLDDNGVGDLCEN